MEIFAHFKESLYFIRRNFAAFECSYVVFNWARLILCPSNVTFGSTKGGGVMNRCQTTGSQFDCHRLHYNEVPRMSVWNRSSKFDETYFSNRVADPSTASEAIFLDAFGSPAFLKFQVLLKGQDYKMYLDNWFSNELKFVRTAIAS